MQTLDNDNCATELVNNGFLKYADSSKVGSLKAQLEDSFDIYDEDNFRIAHIDAEELAEFSFDFFLPSLNRILNKRNVELFVQKLNDKEADYNILINGDTVQLYTQEDLKNDTFWDNSARTFFRKVNNMLRAENVDEQFYLLYGGNDLHAIILTDKQFLIIKNYCKVGPNGIPYKP